MMSVPLASGVRRPVDLGVCVGGTGRPLQDPGPVPRPDRAEEGGRGAIGQGAFGPLRSKAKTGSNKWVSSVEYDKTQS